jgi:hypothetical protein
MAKLTFKEYVVDATKRLKIPGEFNRISRTKWVRADYLAIRQKQLVVRLSDWSQCIRFKAITYHPPLRFQGIQLFQDFQLVQLGALFFAARSYGEVGQFGTHFVPSQFCMQFCK